MTDITTTLTYTADLTRPLRRMNIPALFITDARRAHRITVTVLRAGNPVDLGGAAVSGTVKHLRTGTTIPLSGSAQGSIASVTLPPAAYAQPGDIEIYVTLTSGDVQNCIFAATGCVFPSSTDRVADVPGFYSLAALQEQFSSLDARLRALEEIGIPVTTVDQLVSAVPLDSWKFNLISATANTAYSSTAEAEAGFDDASWRTVSVPHDWSVGLEFNSSSPATYEGGYLDGGDAWYRTTVSVDKQNGRRYVLCFDGVYMESTVYVNGQQVQKNYYGYNPFAVDATEQMVSGVNTIAVFVRNEQPSSRWYSGSGMIRPVELVTLLEQTVVNTLAELGIDAHPRADAPGVYVGEKKICSLGLRIRRGCSFHGLALNVNMDLSPFLRINPCGYAGMEMAKISQWDNNATTDNIAPRLLANILALLNHPPHEYIPA